MSTVRILLLAAVLAFLAAAFWPEAPVWLLPVGLALFAFSFFVARDSRVP